MRVHRAATRAEAEMVCAFLAGQGIPALIRYARGMEVVGVLADGPRELAVRADQADRARALVESFFAGDPAEPRAG